MRPYFRGRSAEGRLAAELRGLISSIQHYIDRRRADRLTMSDDSEPLYYAEAAEDIFRATKWPRPCTGALASMLMICRRRYKETAIYAELDTPADDINSRSLAYNREALRSETAIFSRSLGQWPVTEMHTAIDFAAI